MLSNHIRLCRRFAAGALSILQFIALDVSAQSTEVPISSTLLKSEPALKSASAVSARILGAAKGGGRIIAVGDYGTILLSDDGHNYRQSASVPISSTLTAVSFVDEKNGWAVGHWGAILNTSDGGEHWNIQRIDTAEDRPLFSVHFFDQHRGVAVGLWSLVLITQDGGKTWESIALPSPPDGGKADRNLFKIFSSAKGTTYVAAERGLVLRSDDYGKSWKYISTGYKGSFWSGIALKDGTLLVGGLRGTIYRSHDDGNTWQIVSSGIKSSITDIVQLGSKVVAVALDGIQLESNDAGATFTHTQREDRLSLTAVIAGNVPETPILFSKKGVTLATPLPKASKL